MQEIVEWGSSWPAVSSNIIGSPNQRVLRWAEHRPKLREKKNS